MIKNRLCEKNICYLLFCLIFLTTILPVVSSVKIHTNHDGVKNDTILLNQALEITIYGSYYMKENTPFNFTNGLYTEMVYQGEESILINVSFRLKTTSTNPISVTQGVAENFELPSEAMGQIAISNINFGIGLFLFTVIVDGCGDFAGMHYEKTAFGICLEYNAFIISQQ